jgi:hypothetical protein
MACSLAQKGACQRGGGFLEVLSDPWLGTSMPAIRKGCLYEDCDERCVEACSLRVLRFADEDAWPKLMANEHWTPVPLLPDYEEV